MVQRMQAPKVGVDVATSWGNLLAGLDVCIDS
jgi:hypothetical protein